MNSNETSSSHQQLLNEALNMFVKNMDTAFFKLVVIDEQGLIIQLHGQLSFPKKFTLNKGQNWLMLEERIQWETSKQQGIVRLGNSVYNLIKYEEEGTVQLPYKVFLISSIDIDFPWLKLATSVINTNILALLKGADMQRQMDNTHQFTFAMMNALKVGIISVSTAGEIRYVNNQACQWINIRRRDLLKIPIKNLIPNWKNIYQLVSSGEKFLNEEIAITTPDRKAKFNVTVTPILNQEQVSLIGMVIAIRELENVYHLVNKYTGMQARFTFKDIIAKSQKMRKLVDFAKNISDSPSTILIEAESGTGKEVFAQSIHNASSRHDKGFVAINCAAISDNLIESELFGYDDGAFTGAKKGGHPGKFELANGGTLFLDEVGDMKPEVQVKLLRAIQEGAITRVGGEKNIPVDVRIIAATNKNLKEEVEKGNFRLDLFYRLSVIPLKIPALRERMEDLPSLIRFFLNKKSVRLQKQVPQIRYSTLQQFLDYDWPGNIRELENAIEQYVILDGDISFENLKKELQSPQHVKQPTNTPQTNNSDTPLKLTTVKEMERELILKTIKHFNNNMTHAANSLGVSRNTLYLKIKKYDLPIT
ncbi:sigma 54-interacting transcriptional regulator [Carboxylicivirga sediminis]|uniref:Sigma 54-interacting transcriptional regulator n=1 Tax=Carboxylicivirga sediminis TaxID=2006564 RepID=A0A941IXT5_9BACT|nr:sigma 54-interacting transcriptional regulator [Carboxylicivirga sediminis]MBR8537181.1 sigma 54-interacting transcriptional regulator [Carboxylicivirga sediminis]